MNTSSADTTHSPESGSGRTRASGTRQMKVGLIALLVLLGTFAGLTVAGVTPAGASTLNGVATIADPTSDAPLTSGGSTTPFTVTLPAVSSVPAHCDGDTASDGYLVYSYLVREGTSPTWLSFLNGFASRGYALVSPPHVVFGPQNTASTTGQIINIPDNLEWGPLVSNFGVPLKTLLYANGNKSGVWEAGIACALKGVVKDYWNTEVTFTSSTTDPNKFVWKDTAGACKATKAAFYSAASATFTHGKTNTFIIGSSGCPAPTITEKGTLPGGVTLKTGGVLSGNPTTGGTFKLTLSSKVGSAAAVTQAFTLTVPLFVSTATLPAAKPGVKYSTTLKASGGKTPYKWTETTKLPTSLKLTLSSAGVLSGTVPSGSPAKTYPLVIKVTDSSSPAKTASKSYTFTVS
jgi:hypothetical protein